MDIQEADIDEKEKIPADASEENPKSNPMAAALKATLGAQIVEGVAQQVFEDLNNAPQSDDKSDQVIEDELMEQIAQKMIKDLKKAAEAED